MGRLDLQGGALPAPGQQEMVKTCFDYNGCCWMEGSVIVRNCNGYYIYKINGTSDTCNCAYCVQ